MQPLEFAMQSQINVDLKHLLSVWSIYIELQIFSIGTRGGFTPIFPKPPSRQLLKGT